MMQGLSGDVHICSVIQRINTSGHVKEGSLQSICYVTIAGFFCLFFKCLGKGFVGFFFLVFFFVLSTLWFSERSNYEMEF